MRCCSTRTPVSLVNWSISSSITLPSAPVSPFQYVMVGFAWADARRATVGSVAAAVAPAAVRRNPRRSTLTIVPPRVGERPRALYRADCACVNSCPPRAQSTLVVHRPMHARRAGVAGGGARDRLRNPTLRESQPCGLRALEGAHYACRALPPPAPPARVHLLSFTASIPRRTMMCTVGALTRGESLPRLAGYGQDHDRSGAENRDGGPEDLRKLHRAHRPMHLWRPLRGGIAAQRRTRIPQGRAGGRAVAARARAALARRQLRERLSLARRSGARGRAAAPERARVVRGGIEPLRHGRVHPVLSRVGHRAPHLRQHGHGHHGRGASLGRVLQRHRYHLVGEFPTSARPSRAISRALLGPWRRDVRRLADRQP